MDIAIDKQTGRAIIKFRHHDRSDDLTQNVLKVFIDGALKKGIELKSTKGHLETGAKNSWEDYEIHVKSDK